MRLRRLLPIAQKDQPPAIDSKSFRVIRNLARRLLRTMATAGVKKLGDWFNKMEMMPSLTLKDKQPIETIS